MDMSLFDQNKDDLKSTRSKRDHRNKGEYYPAEVNNLRKKANRRDKPRQTHFDEEENE